MQLWYHPLDKSDLSRFVPAGMAYPDEPFKMAYISREIEQGLTLLEQMAKSDLSRFMTRSDKFPDNEN
jgi:hypothetical protein